MLQAGPEAGSASPHCKPSYGVPSHKTRWRLWVRMKESRTPRLLAAISLSLLVHALGAAWLDFSPPSFPEPEPLRAELRRLPAPPLPAASPTVATPKPRPPQPARPAPSPAPEVPAPPEKIEPPAAAEPPAELAPEPAPEIPSAFPVDTNPPATDEAVAESVLPPRIDLVYTVLYGTIGLHVGESSYRFAHGGGRFSIETVGEPQGLLALFYRGKLRAISRGRITAQGLQPDEVIIERGSPDKRESAQLDWMAQRVTLRDGTQVPFPPGTLDLLSFLLHFYFVSPTQTEIELPIITPRRLNSYRFVRLGTERVHLPLGDFDAEIWSRTASDRSEAEALVWFAPEVGRVPIKIRVRDPQRGTGELRLARILADEEVEPQ